MFWPRRSRRAQKVCVRQNKGRDFGGKHKAACDQDSQELQVIIEHMNMKQGGQQLICGAPEELREKFFQEVRFLDDRISAEVAELFQKKAWSGGALQGKKKDQSRGVEGTRMLSGVMSLNVQHPEPKAPRRVPVSLTAGHVGGSKSV